MNKAIILSAGEGTRMKSKHSKVLNTLLNKEMITYVMDACDFVDEKIVVAGKNYDILRDKFDDSVKIVRQEIGEGFPYGTGYAVKLCLEYVDDDDRVIILTGDTPLIREETLKKFYNYHTKSQSVATVLTCEIDNPFGYGRIVKDKEGNLIKIVEEKDCTSKEKLIKEFNSGIMIVNGGVLKESLDKIDTNNAKGEMYLTDIFEIIRKEGMTVKTYKHDDVRETYGVNTKAQLSFAEEILRERVNTAYMESGVIMNNPAEVTIEPGVKIGRDTVISGPVRIFGKTEIGEDVLIKGDSEIVDSVIGNEVVIRSSYIEKSEVGDGTDIGPYSHLRPNSSLKDHVHIGNFVEVKNSQIGRGTKAGHLTYVGDSTLGENINLGCGVIFVNYDGKNKHRSVIEDGAFIGSNSNIIAPVTVKKDAFVACGTTVTDDVDEGSLCVGRSRQEIKKDWVYKKREKDN